MEQMRENAALEARLCDLASRAERGELAISAFLSPKEGMVATRYVNGRGILHRIFGGYEDAERVRVYFLPLNSTVTERFSPVQLESTIRYLSALSRRCASMR